MRTLLLAIAILSAAGCKSIQTTVNQTGTGHTATVVAGEELGPTGAGPSATAVEASKPTSPVQTGTSNAAADNTKAGQRGGAAATAPNAHASASTVKNSIPWWVYALLVCGGIIGGWMLRGKASVWGW